MKVVLIVPDSSTGGGLFQFYNQLASQLAAFADVHVVFASPFDESSSSDIPGATCHRPLRFNDAGAPANLSNMPVAVAPWVARALSVAHQAWRFALTLAPDVVEVCDWPLGAAPAAVDTSVPVVVQCHGSMAQIAKYDGLTGNEVETMILRLIEPQILAHAGTLQTPAHANARFWQQACGRTVDVIRPAFALPANSIGHDDGSIAIFGRLQAWKGPDVLCAALSRLGDRAPICEWYGSAKRWPGTGISADAYLAAKWPAIWGRNLRFHGGVDRAAVRSLMSRSRAVIVPSTWDVFNFTAVEAMALGRPVLVSKGAGASELIQDGVNGLTFQADDPAALADAMTRLQALDAPVLRAMGQAARDTVRRELDPERIARQRLDGYRTAIRDHDQKLRATPEWLRQVISPDGAGCFNLPDFFDTLPARPMVRALARRAHRKLGWTPSPP